MIIVVNEVAAPLSKHRPLTCICLSGWKLGFQPTFVGWCLRLLLFTFIILFVVKQRRAQLIILIYDNWRQWIGQNSPNQNLKFIYVGSYYLKKWMRWYSINIHLLASNITFNELLTENIRTILRIYYTKYYISSIFSTL